VSRPHTLATGASNLWKQRSVMDAAISAPNPPVIGASWLTRSFPVLLTEASTVSLSHGISVLRSMSSQDIPSYHKFMSAIDFI
jgi:hypothetical protein